MDVFKFTNPTHPMRMERGEIINGLTKKTWIERYAEAGEFSFTALASSGIKEKLPIGSFVSHVNSTELMIVENHELSEDNTKETEIIVSGRGFETILERTVIGLNKTFPATSGVEDYTMPLGVLWTQVRDLIRMHIYAANVMDSKNSIPYVEVINKVSAPASAIERSARQGDLYSAVLSLMQEVNIGIKAVRPGPWSPVDVNENVGIVIHNGAYRQNTISFSYDQDEIVNADYLWSSRKNKNCALITSRWVETTVVGSELNQDRRWMIVDASDIDQKYDVAPTGTTLTSIVNKMKQRGLSELGKQKNIALTKAELNKESVNALYRTDYDLGDLVSIKGNYSETAVQRVTEYVEIEDETGRSAYPTLSDPE
jgi:hypothetical protein